MLRKAQAVACLLIMVVQAHALQDAGDDKCRPVDESPQFLAHRSSTPKKVLVATPLKNAGHALHDFAKALQGLTYPKEHMEVAFLVSDSVDNTAEVVREVKETSLRDFAKVHIFKQDFHFEAPEDRHAYEVQAARRSILAKSRNVLIEKALTDDTHAVLWLDVDITGYPTSLVEDLLATGRPVVAPHVLIGPLTYDRNTWRETRPEEAFKIGGPEVVFEGYPETALAGGERVYMDDLRDSALARGIEKNHRYAVCIDGVGTAVLFVQARVHRAGVVFPEKPYKKRLESEGFGLWAKDRGFQPCGLPFYNVYHYDEWSEEIGDDAARQLQAIKNASRPERPTPKPEAICQTWCKDLKEAAWAKKCTYKNCKGCQQCVNGGKDMPAPIKNGNMSKPMPMACKGKPECKGKEQNVCLRLEKEGKCEWAPKEWIEKGDGKEPMKGKGECDGPAECARKDKDTCEKLQKEGKCKWKILKEADLIPGECVGKRGQAECDDKDKFVCKQLQSEKKCAWVPAPSERKTPTGKCLGAAECLNKPRRVCHRMRLQEGKACRYKPAPENEVKVDMTLMNVKLTKLDEKAQGELKDTLAKKIAEKADVDDTAVNVTLSEGSIKVSAVIDMEEKIGLMEAANEGKDVDLISEMKSLKSEVQNEVGSEQTAQEVLVSASSIEGVQEAAEGLITISSPETSVTAESNTKAPVVVTDDVVVIDDASPAPSPGGSPAPAPSEDATTTVGPARREIDAAGHKNAFMSFVIGTVAVVMMQ